MTMKRILLALALVVALAGAAHAWPLYTATATVTIATDNNTSSAVTPARDCKYSAGVYIPTIDTSTVIVHVSMDGTNYGAYLAPGAAAPGAAWTVASGTGGNYVGLPAGVLAFKYIRFEFGSAQTANRSLLFGCN